MNRRKPTAQEVSIVKRLLDLGSGDTSLKEELASVDVENMNDGGMGSIKFVHSSPQPAKFGKELVVATGRDSDGVELSIALNLDEFGRLFELDVWKVDSSPIITLPPADTLEMARY